MTLHPRRLARLLGLSLLAAAGAQADFPYRGDVLALKGQAQACHLGFIRLYDIEYFGAREAAAGATRCVRITYRRGFSAKTLAEATDAVFRERHGSTDAERFRDDLAQVAAAYRAVEPGDVYTYCLDAGGGVLLRDRREVLRFESTGFAQRYLQIWVTGEDAELRPEWAFARC